MEYQGSKKATISIWRSRIASNDAGEMELFAMETLSNQIIRDENGDANDSAEAGLYLELQDFAPEAMFPPGEFKCDPIKISATTLCSYIEIAENRAVMVEQRNAIFLPLQPGVKKRSREITPTEEVEGRRKKIFRDSEERVLEQAERHDSSFQAGSSSDTGNSQGS
ncbi:hypothetical protein BPAE_0313g00030 [Botrytis paeoniae]|uniref:Uncharacterized protein n=1 Tax=Botrytis paeoniae TaxID=278948 RepID=A0A4Z1FBS4_9HELO|nr:hypothetical protein BPAE_0313g00030 [Botrytis paeoniae]